MLKAHQSDEPEAEEELRAELKRIYDKFSLSRLKAGTRELNTPRTAKNNTTIRAKQPQKYHVCMLKSSRQARDKNRRPLPY